MQHPHAFTEPPEPGAAAQQVAALCLRTGPGGPEVLMVTSLTTRRWLLPKGWPVPGLALPQSALEEAWEEAGVTGSAADQPEGSYRYRKLRRARGAIDCVVQVFRVEVQDLADHYPESGQRQRAWFPLEQAAQVAGEPGLRRLLAAITA